MPGTGVVGDQVQYDPNPLARSDVDEAVDVVQRAEFGMDVEVVADVVTPVVVG